MRKSRNIMMRVIMTLIIIHYSLFINAQTGSGSRIYHIYREWTEQGLKGAQILNNIQSDQAVLEEGDTYIHNNKVYVIMARTALNFSGLFAHLYVWVYDEELTIFFQEIGVIPKT